MREWTMVEGQQVPVQSIDRGPMLLRSREEWMARYQAVAAGAIMPLAFLVAALLIAVVLLVPGGNYLLLAVPCGVLIGIYGGLAIRTLNDINRGGAVPGIYEKGLELPIFPIYFQRLFIPWEEIEDAVLQSGPLPANVLMITVRSSRWKWRFPERLLGPEGYGLVQECISGGEEPEGPGPPAAPGPKLVLYTSRGAKMESVPGEERP